LVPEYSQKPKFFHRVTERNQKCRTTKRADQLLKTTDGVPASSCTAKSCKTVYNEGQPPKEALQYCCHLFAQLLSSLRISKHLNAIISLPRRAAEYINDEHYAIQEQGKEDFRSTPNRAVLMTTAMRFLNRRQNRLDFGV